jgi:uroporphyrinogen-III synthase
MSAKPLAGRRVLVTRPREQSGLLVSLVRKAGGAAILFPAIEIAGIPDPADFYRVTDRLEEFDLAIFISPTAVQKALELIVARGRNAPWPRDLRVAALGAGTTRTLERHDLAPVIAPRTGEADSEALLALPQLANVAGKAIVIFRGQGGRELLRDTLVARGARVQYAECYSRVRPAVPAGEPEWAREALDAVTVSSSEGLANLDFLLRAWRRDWLQESPLFVPHARVAAEAARLGARETIVAGPGDDNCARALIAYFSAAK